MTKRPIVFILASTNYGPMILTRMDHFKINDNEYGVGFEILRDSEYGPYESQIFKDVLTYRRQSRGDGAIFIDCGANIGAFTVDMAKHMLGWGNVIAIEAQERIYYALAGNIAINNLFNAMAMNVAISDKTGSMNIPKLDYTIPTSFGSVELKPLAERELIGQTLDYDNNLTRVACFTIDSMNLERVDLIKIDIEGMEMEALRGSNSTIHFHHPIIYVEYHKVGEQAIKDFLEPLGYKTYHNYRNLLCVHESDAINLKIEENQANLPDGVELAKGVDEREKEYVKVEENKQP